MNGNFDSFFTEDCHFIKNTSSMYGLDNSILLEGGYFAQGFAVLGGIVEDVIHVNGGYYKMQLFFGRNAIIKSDIIVQKGELSRIEANEAIIDNFIIYSTSYKLNRSFIPELAIGKGIKRLRISPAQYDNDKENFVFIKKIHFKDSPELAIIEPRCIIGELVLSNHVSLSSSTILLNKIKVGEISFNNYINNGKLALVDIRPRLKKNTISIEASNLGVTDFTSCDLSKFKLFIDDSKLVNIFYTSTSFPNVIQSKKKGIDNYRQLRDTYDQLQTIASKQGDRVSNLSWQHSSLKYYLKSLEPFKSRKWLILTLMMISNNFRMSSGLALVFTLVAGLIFFSLYALSTESALQVGLPGPETVKSLLASTTLRIEYYWEFLNPTHKWGFMSVKQYSPGWANLFDILGRITVGFGIYQFIQAFRRFGKGE